MNKEKNMQKLHNMFAHQIKRFSISANHTTNHQYNCNLFFNVDMIVSSFDTICPKKSHHIQLLSILLLP